MRVQLTDGGGHLIHPKLDGRYSIDIVLGRFTGLVTAGTIFALRNASTRHCRITRVVLYTGFAGTTAATAQILQLKRFSAATPSGGTAITLAAGAVRHRNIMRDAILADARYADITGTAPLTVTNVVFEPSMGSVSFPRSSGGGITGLEFIWTKDNAEGFHLADDEGFALVTTQTAVVGDLITGYVEFDQLVHSGAGQ
jgi:hypothetical protein